MSTLRPYPGMRPFERDESDLFFGQEEQVAELVTRLGRSRLLAVVGDSGCGKSSLVKAGVIPTLLGRRSPETALWRISVSQPGIAPIRQLAESLSKSVSRTTDIDSVDKRLRESSYGLVDIVQQSNIPGGHRVLIVIDQFEELFRLWRDSATVHERDEAALFVKLLLAVTEVTTQSSTVPIYVLLTIRSEYLGDCALFFGLAEAMNDGAFLLPKMRRSSVEAAIVRPLDSFQGLIDNDVLQELLNEAEVAQQDGLPLLQHALRQLWDRAAARPTPVRITFDDLRAVSQSTPGALYLEKELNARLDGLLNSKLTRSQDQKVAATLFKQLAEYDAKGRLVRVRCDLNEAMAVCGVGVDELLRVADAFRDNADGQSFLTPPLERTEALKHGRESLSICHEALLRHWVTLGEWIDQEAKDAEAFRALAGRAVAVDRPPALRSAELARATALNKRVLTAPWSRRYQGRYDPTQKRFQFDYAATITFLHRSRVERGGRYAAYALVAVAVIGLGAHQGCSQIDRLRERADAQARLARTRQEAAQTLETSYKKLTVTNEELAKKESQLRVTVDELKDSQGRLNDQVRRTRQAWITARAEGDKREIARKEAVAATAEADRLRAEAVKASDELEGSLAQLQRETQLREEAENGRRARDQRLRLLATVDDSSLDAASRLKRLGDLANESADYARQYAALPPTVLDTLSRWVQLSFLQKYDDRSSDPVLAVMPDPELPAGLLAIRRGALPADVAADVQRGAWSVQRATFDPTHRQMMVGGAGGYTAIPRKEESPGVTRKLHPFAVSGLGFSTDGEWVATASAAGDMRLLRNADLRNMSIFKDRFIQFGNATKLVTFLVLHRYRGDYAVREFALAVAPHDGQRAERRHVSVVALTEAGRVLLWLKPGPFGKQLSRLDGISVPGTFTALATNPVSQEVWIAGGAQSSDARLGIFEMTSRVTPCRGVADGLTVSSMTWSADGKRLALGLSNGSIRVVAKDTPAGCGGTSIEIEIPAHGTAVTTLSWHDDLLASGAGDGSARLWSMPSTPDERKLLAALSALSASVANVQGQSSGPPAAALDTVLAATKARVMRLKDGR